MGEFLGGVVVTLITLLILINIFGDEYELVVEDQQGRTFIVTQGQTRSDCEVKSSMFTNLPQFPVVYCRRNDQ